jgi:glutaredoxin-like YruB-family protein
MIKIYSTPSCVYCKTLKSYLTSKNIEFSDIDVSTNEKELEHMVKVSGQMGVPVVEIDDNVIVGFDKNRIDELLKI